MHPLGHGMTALLHAASWTAFADRAVADLAEWPAAVHAVLAAEEAKLLPLAEKALRAGKPLIVNKIGKTDAGARAAADRERMRRAQAS